MSPRDTMRYRFSRPQTGQGSGWGRAQFSELSLDRRQIEVAVLTRDAPAFDREDVYAIAHDLTPVLGCAHLVLADEMA